MTMRVKWEIDDKDPVYMANNGSETDRKMILELLNNDSLTVHFQPIFSIRDSNVIGYEALTRIKGNNPFPNISELFKKALNTDTISLLDLRARENAMRVASAQGITHSGQYLFINISPETLQYPAYKSGMTDGFTEKWSIPKDKIILEITEESAVHNYSIFKQAVTHYRERGYKIAIDDFGVGHGGLKMLSEIEPDFVKIDRHFISDIDKASIKHNLVDAIATLCFRIGIKVIAEGVEQEEELRTISNMGIDLLQGYYLAKPSPLINGNSITIPAIPVKKSSHLPSNGEYHFIGDITDKIETIHPAAPVITASDMFIKNPELWVLPVIESEKTVGMLHRRRFFEEQILGRCGYAIHLNAHKNVRHIMETQFLSVEANTPLEDVVQRVNSRRSEFLYDDVCVTEKGRYSGIVAINSLLEAITKKSLILARGSNPLTGLPGNEFIQKEIEKRLIQNIHFDVAYIDINNFKPYNDRYGFERGDHVIKRVGSIVENAVKFSDSEGSNFAGHIGGDDFIMVTAPQFSIPLSEKIILEFEAQLTEFHGMEDKKKGFYISKNRKGEEERFDLLSLSIGIVSTEVNKIETYAHFASIAAEVKKAAKMQDGSSIVRDKRMMG